MSFYWGMDFESIKSNESDRRDGLTLTTTESEGGISDAIKHFEPWTVFFSDHSSGGGDGRGDDLIVVLATKVTSVPSMVRDDVVILEVFDPGSFTMVIIF